MTDKPIKDKQGKILTSTEEQLKRWVEHFSELLNRPGPEDPPDIPPAETELSINCAKPSRHEIRKAIQALKNGKAAGIDSVPAEALKVDIGTSTALPTDYSKTSGRRKRFQGTGKKDFLSNYQRKET